MSGHLSARQIDECMLGQPGVETERHLRECARCQAELARLREAFGAFRHSVHHWTEAQLPGHSYLDWTAKPARTWTLFSRLSFAVVAVALCLLVAFSLPWRRTISPATQSAADAALLSQIDAEVSRTVPTPMEPLTKLVSNDSP